MVEPPPTEVTLWLTLNVYTFGGCLTTTSSASSTSKDVLGGRPVTFALTVQQIGGLQRILQGWLLQSTMVTGRKGRINCRPSPVRPRDASQGPDVEFRGSHLHGDEMDEWQHDPSPATSHTSHLGRIQLSPRERSPLGIAWVEHICRSCSLLPVPPRVIYRCRDTTGLPWV